LLHIEAKVFEFCSTESLKIGFPEAQGTSLVSAIGGRDLCLVFATATGHPGEVFFEPNMGFVSTAKRRKT
jgi:hypothetical protein